MGGITSGGALLIVFGIFLLAIALAHLFGKQH